MRDNTSNQSEKRGNSSQDLEQDPSNFDNLKSELSEPIVGES